MSGNSKLWRVAGGLAIVHVALMFGSFSLQRVADLGAKPASVTSAFVAHSATQGFAGAYLTLLSFVVFLLAATLLARLLRGGGEVSAWLSSAITATATIYVAVTLAAELANVGAAIYDGHHGAPLSTVTALDHAHWFGVFAATAVLGVFTFAVAAAALVGRELPRWIGFTGLVPGLLCLASGAGPRTGLVGGATMLWAIWFVALGVVALRRGQAVMAPVRSERLRTSEA